MFRKAFICMAIALALPGTTAHAQTAPTDQTELDPAYGQLYDAMRSGVDVEADMVRQLDAVISAIVRQGPEMKRLAANPAFEPGLKQVMMPYLRRHVAMIAPIQRRELTALMARYLTPAEAQTWIGFYSSPLGHKVMATAQQNAVSTSVANSVASTGEVDAKAVESDVKRTASATGRALQGKLTLQEQSQMLALMRKPSYAKLIALMRELPQVRAQIENTPMDPALEAEAQVAIAEFTLKIQGVNVDTAQ